MNRRHRKSSINVSKYFDDSGSENDEAIAAAKKCDWIQQSKQYEIQGDDSDLLSTGSRLPNHQPTWKDSAYKIHTDEALGSDRESENEANSASHSSTTHHKQKSDKAKDEESTWSKASLGDLYLSAPFSQEQEPSSEEKAMLEKKERRNRKRSTIVSPIDRTKLSFAQATPFPGSDQIAESPPPPTLLQNQKEGKENICSLNGMEKKQKNRRRQEKNKLSISDKTPFSVPTFTDATKGLDTCIRNVANKYIANEEDNNKEDGNSKQPERHGKNCSQQY